MDLCFYKVFIVKVNDLLFVFMFQHLIFLNKIKLNVSVSNLARVTRKY